MFFLKGLGMNVIQSVFVLLINPLTPIVHKLDASPEFKFKNKKESL